MRVAKLFMACSIVMVIVPSVAQVQTNIPTVVPGAKPVKVEHIKVHGAALEGNLEGDAVDRDVIVFLPPSYQEDTKRRYPVVYALHGYSIGAEQWTHEIHVPQTVEGAFATGSQEMIVVLPDSKTVYNGSMYSSSVTTGDFEKFIWHDVVSYIDAHYRTFPKRESRGLVGHSMGGYGASRIGMKHPDVFGALYIMSPCCMSPMTGGGPGPADQMKERAIAGEKKVAAAKSPGDLQPSRPASVQPSTQQRQHGPQTRRIRRSTSICQRKTAFRSRRLSRNTVRTHRWPLWINTSETSGNIALSRWMSATRTDCASTRSSCTHARQLRNRKQFRDLLRHPRQCSRGSLPEPRTTVLQ